MSTESRDYGSNGPRGRDPESIARAIDETRGEVDQTLSALQAQLSPGELLDRAMQLLRDSGGQFANNLGRSVRDNPLPVILTGVGLAWMMSSSRTVERGYASSYRQRSASPAGDGEHVTRAAADTLASAREHISGAAESVSDAATATADKVSHGMENAAELLRSQSRRVSESFADLLQEQPLIVGAIGVALGALLGYVLPATQVEDRLLGDASDRATQGAAAAASTQLDQATEMMTASAGRRQPCAGSSERPPVVEQASATQGVAEDHEARGVSERT